MYFWRNPQRQGKGTKRMIEENCGQHCLFEFLPWARMLEKPLELQMSIFNTVGLCDVCRWGQVQRRPKASWVSTLRVYVSVSMMHCVKDWKHCSKQLIMSHKSHWCLWIVVNKIYRRELTLPNKYLMLVRMLCDCCLLTLLTVFDRILDLRWADKYHIDSFQWQTLEWIFDYTIHCHWLSVNVIMISTEHHPLTCLLIL